MFASHVSRLVLLLFLLVLVLIKSVMMKLLVLIKSVCQKKLSKKFFCVLKKNFVQPTIYC